VCVCVCVRVCVCVCVCLSIFLPSVCLSLCLLSVFYLSVLSFLSGWLVGWLSLSVFPFVQSAHYSAMVSSDCVILRQAPDPQCDIGTHEFIYSLMPHAGQLYESAVIRQG
jgi:hypothetical protein